MSLAASYSSFKADQAAAAQRNLAHARPGQAPAAPTARTSTPKPAIAVASSSSVAGDKRAHETAFPGAPSKGTGNELITQTYFAVKYLKEKFPQAVTIDDLISYLSIPPDLERHIPFLRQALGRNERIEYLNKSDSGLGKEAVRYRPLHPVGSADELKAYLNRQPTAQGISVKELKDGWPECIAVIAKLEADGDVLVTRNKKDNTPKLIWADRPEWHSEPPMDVDFRSFWDKTKLPANESDLRLELEKGGMTPTSEVKIEVKRDMKKKEKRKVNRRGGKTTNTHMIGILKDYSRSK